MISRQPFPGTNWRVSPIGLGTAFLGVKQSEAAARELLDHYVAQGGNFIDTARVYSDWVPGEIGRSERIIGDWLRRRSGLRDQIVISTKGVHHDLATPELPRVTPEAARHDVEASLKALHTECIDLYWLHRDDPTIPAEEIIEFMQPVVRAGKVRALGASNWTTARIIAANTHARAHGLAPFVASQPLFHVGCWSLLPFPDRTLVRLTPEMHADHVAAQLPLVAYSPQAQGYFTRLAAGKQLENEACRTPENLRLGPVLAALAEKYRTSVNAVVLAYVLQQPFPCFPIIGPYRREQLDDSVQALALKLSHEDLNWLNDVNGFSCNPVASAKMPFTTSA